MKKTLLVILLITTLLLVAACSSNAENNDEGTTTYKDITSEELFKLMQQEDIFLIDVHVPEQRHIKGTDAVIPYNKISESNELPKDKNKKIVVYCRSGSMSREAADTLIKMGYKNVLNLGRGVNEWKQKNLPLE